MFLSSLLIVTIISIVINTIFLSFFIQIQTKFSFKELDYIQKQLEFFVTSTDNYSRTIISDSLIQEFANGYKKGQIIPDLPIVNTLKGEIKRIIQNTKYIHSVSLYDTKQNLLISTDNYATAIEPLALKTLNSTKWISTTKKNPLAPSLSVYTFSCIRPFYNYFTGEHLGYIEIALLESQIREVFDKHLADTNTIFIVDQEGIIQSTNSTYSLQSIYPDIKLLDLKQNFYYSFKNNCITFYQFFPAFEAYIINQTPIYFFMNPIYTLLLVCFGVSIFCIILYIPLAHKIANTITLPIMEVIHHTKKIKEGIWEPLEVSKTDTDILLLVDAFNSMVIAQEELKNKLLATQQAKDKLTLNLLQEQINPHFFYNTLDNICSLAEIGEIDMLNQLIYNLSNFYRKGLSNGKSYITVQEELDMIRSYIHIMQVRYYDKFNFSIECPDHLLPYPCLKFLLQPIVENSIYHGILPLSYKGDLQITIFESQNTLSFIVEDNGIGISEENYNKIWEEESDHFGLKNIHHRIQLHYGKDYGVHIKNSEKSGCQVSITLNKKGGNSCEF